MCLFVFPRLFACVFFIGMCLFIGMCFFVFRGMIVHLYAYVCYVSNFQVVYLRAQFFPYSWNVFLVLKFNLCICICIYEWSILASLHTHSHAYTHNLWTNRWRPFVADLWNWMDTFVVGISIMGLTYRPVPAVNILRYISILFVCVSTFITSIRLHWGSILPYWHPMLVISTSFTWWHSWIYMQRCHIYNSSERHFSSYSLNSGKSLFQMFCKQTCSGTHLHMCTRACIPANEYIHQTGARDQDGASFQKTEVPSHPHHCPFFIYRTFFLCLSPH